MQKLITFFQQNISMYLPYFKIINVTLAYHFVKFLNNWAPVCIFIFKTSLEDAFFANMTDLAFCGQLASKMHESFGLHFRTAQFNNYILTIWRNLKPAL